MFQLTREEIEFVKSQFVISPKTNLFTGQSGGSRKLPFAFTEQGIYMLATVLKGELAEVQSIALIRIFKKMKDYIANNEYLIADKALLALTSQTLQNTADIAGIKNEMIKKSDLPEIIRSFTNSKIKSEYLIYDGELIEADLAYKEVYEQAKSSIYIVDNYIGIKTLYLLKDIKPDIGVTIFSDNVGSGITRIEYADFQREFPDISIDFKKTCNKVHDRFIMLDFGTENEKLYHCGASSKDAGRRVTAISKLVETSCYKLLFNNLLSNPDLTLR